MRRKKEYYEGNGDHYSMTPRAPAVFPRMCGKQVTLKPGQKTLCEETEIFRRLSFYREPSKRLNDAVYSDLARIKCITIHG